MKRTIVQITNRYIDAESNATLIALADDGTLWEGIETRVIDQAAGNGKPMTHHWEWRWESINGLPDNTTNLSKVR